MAEHQFVTTLIKAFAVLRNAGYKTFGQWSDAEALAKARTFALVLAKDPKVTTEIIQATALRYANGEVTIWQSGAQVPASLEFPAAPQFRDACVQTWHELYRLVAIGEKIEDGARVLITTVEKRSESTSTPPVLDPPATPEQIAAARARIAALVPRTIPSGRGAIITRPFRESNPEADSVLAQMAEIRRRHEGAE